MVFLLTVVTPVTQSSTHHEGCRFEPRQSSHSGIVFQSMGCPPTTQFVSQTSPPSILIVASLQRSACPPCISQPKDSAFCSKPLKPLQRLADTLVWQCAWQTVLLCTCRQGQTPTVLNPIFQRTQPEAMGERAHMSCQGSALAMQTADHARFKSASAKSVISINDDLQYRIGWCRRGSVGHQHDLAVCSVQPRKGSQLFYKLG